MLEYIVIILLNFWMFLNSQVLQKSRFSTGYIVVSCRCYTSDDLIWKTKLSISDKVVVVILTHGVIGSYKLFSLLLLFDGKFIQDMKFSFTIKIDDAGYYYFNSLP